MRKWLLSGVLLLIAYSVCGSAALAWGFQPTQPRDTGVTWNLGPTFPSNTGNVPTVVPTQDTQLDFDIPSYETIGWEVYSGDGDTVDINLVPAARVSGLRQSCASAAPVIRVGTTNAPSDSLNGSFTVPWPKNATIAAGGQFWVVCLHEHVRDSSFAYGGDLMSGTSANATATSANGGLAFEVLTDTVPTASISAGTVAQGQMLTVRGTGWKYYHSYTAYGANTACGAVQIKIYPGGGHLSDLGWQELYAGWQWQLECDVLHQRGARHVLREHRLRLLPGVCVWHRVHSGARVFRHHWGQRHA